MLVNTVTDNDNKLVLAMEAMEIDSFGPQAAANRWWLPVIIKYGKVFTATDHKGDLLGICLLLRDWNDCTAAFIHSFHIRKDYRHQGQGNQFLKKVLQKLKKEGIKTVGLTVSPHNQPAQKLYQKNGFKFIKLSHDQYGPGQDRHLMELKL